MTDVWLLTTEYNAYDQFGEYFLEMFAEFPTFEQLREAVGKDKPWYGVSDDLLVHIKNGGGRQATEDQWFHLKRYTPK